MCLWNTDTPCSNKVKIWHKSLSPTFWLAPPQGHMMSMKFEEPIDELTVQVWLLYHPNFKYCTFFVSRTDRRTWSVGLWPCCTQQKITTSSFPSDFSSVSAVSFFASFSSSLTSSPSFCSPLTLAGDFAAGDPGAGDFDATSRLICSARALTAGRYGILCNPFICSNSWTWILD